MRKGLGLKNGFGIAATSSPLSRERAELGIQNITKLGYQSFYSLEPFKYYADYTFGFANGSPAERLLSLNSAIDNLDLECVLASRGGTGALDLLDSLSIDQIAQAGKIFIGQSDFTVLLLQAAFKAKVPSILGPTLGAEFASYFDSSDAKESIDLLLKMLTDKNFRIRIKGEVLQCGSHSTGALLGGNLSMLVSLMGTPFDVPYDDTILVIEEVGESPHKIDRMLSQLVLSGKLNNVRGICFGRFSRCESKVGPSVDDVLQMFCDKLKVFNRCPVLKNLPFGHWGLSTPLPLGIGAEIKDDILVTIESPIN